MTTGRQHPSDQLQAMSEVLLEVLATLYHSPDATAKARASQWLEEWRLKTEAWNAVDSVLHSHLRNLEVLFFCSQTLVFKVNCLDIPHVSHSFARFDKILKNCRRVNGLG